MPALLIEVSEVEDGSEIEDVSGILAADDVLTSSSS